MKMHPSRQEIEISHTARFYCYGQDVVWMFQNDEPLPSNAYSEKDGVLVIHHVDVPNEGYYECKGKYYWRNSFVFYGRGYLSVYGNNIVYCARINNPFATTGVVE